MSDQFFERGVGGIEVFDGVIAHLANLVQALELVRSVERHKIARIAVNTFLQFGPAALFCQCMPPRKDGNKLRAVFVGFERVDVVHVLAEKVRHERRVKQAAVPVGIIFGIDGPEKRSPFGAFTTSEQVRIHVPQERDAGLFHAVFDIVKFGTCSRQDGKIRKLDVAKFTRSLVRNLEVCLAALESAHVHNVVDHDFGIIFRVYIRLAHQEWLDGFSLVGRIFFSIGGALRRFEFKTEWREKFVAGFNHCLGRAPVCRKHLAVCNLVNGIFVNLDVCALETIDRLLRIAYHQNMVESIVGIKEHALENFPLQQVRVLEFVDDGEQVFLPQRIYQRRIVIKDCLVDVSNHVVEGLNLACILVELPSIKKLGRVFVKALVQKQRFDTARFFVEQSLQILDDAEGRIQFRAIAHDIELERRAVI